MKQVRVERIAADDPAGLAAFRSLDRHGPAGAPRPPMADARLLLARRGGEPVSRASFRVEEGLTGYPGRTGVIGHYEARGGEEGVAVLREALAALVEVGVDRVVGPMDGTTWDRYRLALPTPESGDPPPFLSEPVNPLEYGSHFDAAGLTIAEGYESRLVAELDALAGRTREVEERLAERHLRFDPLDLTRFDDALVELHRLSLEAFADNALYSPIDLDRFRTLYLPMKQLLDPDLVLITRDADDRAVGFALAFPDLLDPAGRPTRIVVKSLAVAPAARSGGLGSLLVHEAHRRAAAKGYSAAIHALMHVANDSLKISRHGGLLFRRYALYGWVP